MIILHYALGFPPYRSGGLTRYVMDLAREQKRQGDTVAMLWPGTMHSSSRPYVRKNRSVDGIQSYMLRNPLPIVLDKQVGDPSAFHRPVQRDGYIEFLVRLHPDVIHIHTLQGLHSEFMDAAELLQIPTIFTTHDFFGFYPMNAVYPMDHALRDAECSSLNSAAPSLSRIIFLQSSFVRAIKSSSLARRTLSSSFSKRGASQDPALHSLTRKTALRTLPYHDFRQYEVDIVNRMSEVLYNSTISKHAYEEYCAPDKSRILPLTHASLPVKRIARKVQLPIHLAFLGGERPYKGLSLLLRAFDVLAERSVSCFHLDIFGLAGSDTNLVSFKAAFTDFSRAMAQEDIIVVPSLTYESFGFVVLEALSAGIPVLISKYVGAQDILPDGDGWVVSVSSPEQFVQGLLNITRSDIGKRIQKIHTFHSQDIRSQVSLVKHVYQSNINGLEQDEACWGFQFLMTHYRNEMLASFSAELSLKCYEVCGNDSLSEKCTVCCLSGEM